MQEFFAKKKAYIAPTLFVTKLNVKDIIAVSTLDMLDEDDVDLGYGQFSIEGYDE